MKVLRNLTNKKDIKDLFKSLGLNVRGLKDYKTLWGGTINTWAHHEASMWFYTYYPSDGSIEINSTYFKPTELLLKYNKKCKTLRVTNPPTYAKDIS